MMIEHHAREFTTGAELRAHYAAVRRRMLKAGRLQIERQRNALAEKFRNWNVADRRRRARELKREYWELKLAARELAHPMRLIASEAASFYGVSYDDVLSSRRTMWVSWARAITAFIAWNYWLRGYSKVARRLHVDHTSVIYACHRVAERIQNDSDARVDLMTIIGRLKEVLQMTAPENAAAFNKRFRDHHRVTGFYETLHLPCPFCAADDWLITSITEFQDKLTRGAMCIECGRSAAAVFDGKQFDIVQIAGTDPPDWHRELMPTRRI